MLHAHHLTWKWDNLADWIAIEFLCFLLRNTEFIVLLNTEELQDKGEWRVSGVKLMLGERNVDMSWLADCRQEGGRYKLQVLSSDLTRPQQRNQLHAWESLAKHEKMLGVMIWGLLLGILLTHYQHPPSRVFLSVWLLITILIEPSVVSCVETLSFWILINFALQTKKPFQVCKAFSVVLKVE